MDKETYIKRLKSCEDVKRMAMAEYNNKKAKLDKLYIDENCPYKIGDKMIFDGKPVIMDSIRVHYDGSFVYYVRKTKKDGTPSQIVQCVYSCSMHKLKKA